MWGRENLSPSWPTTSKEGRDEHFQIREGIGSFNNWFTTPKQTKAFMKGHMFVSTAQDKKLREI